jgi:hypothetical protein
VTVTTTGVTTTWRTCLRDIAQSKNCRLREPYDRADFSITLEKDRNAGFLVFILFFPWVSSNGNPGFKAERFRFFSVLVPIFRLESESAS